MLKALTKTYQSLIFFGGLLKSPLLLLCRLYWGWLFITSGWWKFQHMEEFVQTLYSHFPAGHTLLAYLAASSELIGGFCLLIGFASRLVAIPLIITMFAAYSIAHGEALHQLFHHPDLFVAESPFNFLFCSLLVLTFGPGRFSIDYILEKWLFGRAQSFPKH
jgi:putative oxidoreductase